MNCIVFSHNARYDSTNYSYEMHCYLSIFKRHIIKITDKGCKKNRCTCSVISPSQGWKGTQCKIRCVPQEDHPNRQTNPEAGKNPNMTISRTGSTKRTGTDHIQIQMAETQRQEAHSTLVNWLTNSGSGLMRCNDMSIGKV